MLQYKLTLEKLSNHMSETMNFSSQDSPIKQKMGEDVSFHGAPAPGFPTWPWKTPSGIRARLCAIWTDSLVCRAALCVAVAWLVVSANRSLEPAPVAARPNSRVLAYLKHYPGQLWAPHSSHTTLYYWANYPKYSHCPTKTVHCFFLDGSKIIKKTWTANL